MGILGGICFFIGFIIMAFYGINLLILAFKTSVLWGLGQLCSACLMRSMTDSNFPLNVHAFLS